MIKVFSLSTLWQAVAGLAIGFASIAVVVIAVSVFDAAARRAYAEGYSGSCESGANCSCNTCSPCAGCNSPTDCFCRN